MMLCDELKYEKLGYMMSYYPCSTLVTRKQFVDAAIAELKAKLESVQATAYTESVDAGMRERKLKRALWMSRKAHAVAMVAYWDSHYRDNPNAVYRNRTVDWLRNRWLLILDAIIKKEKEYK